MSLQTTLLRELREGCAQGVPGADTVLKYMGHVIKFCARHLVVVMKPLAVLVDALNRVVRQPCPVELTAAVAFDEAVSIGVRLALVLLWFGDLRGWEILSARVLDFDEQFCLRRQDCSVAPDGSSVSLSFRKAKYDVKNIGGFRYLHPGGTRDPWALRCVQ